MGTTEIVKIAAKGNEVLFDHCKFVLRARSTDADELRFVLKRLHVTADYFEATDGHRLHRATFNFPAKVGLYEILKSTKTEIWLERTEGEKFPDSYSVVEDAKKKCTIRKVSVEGSIKQYSIKLFTLIRSLPFQTCFEIKYYRDIIFEEIDIMDVFISKYKNPRDPIYFKDRDGVREALLMPIYTGQ